jgi:hypothetical protein
MIRFRMPCSGCTLVSWVCFLWGDSLLGSSGWRRGNWEEVVGEEKVMRGCGVEMRMWKMRKGAGDDWRSYHVGPLLSSAPSSCLPLSNLSSSSPLPALFPLSNLSFYANRPPPYLPSSSPLTLSNKPSLTFSLQVAATPQLQTVPSGPQPAAPSHCNQVGS